MVNAKPDSCQILVVDDNPDAAFTLVMLLKLKGYDACSYPNGREGIEATERLRPDVVLLDLAMPEIDGYETCRTIRMQPSEKEIVVIALSGYNQPEDIRLSWESGFDAHLVKPVDLDILTQRITPHLALKRVNG
ncbi:response regulator [Spirosoma radiotolerans]|uniref:response regulator n=1 Tax=Spirosoma radiotolerans TaxID=1379870 RepID=UPI00061CE039|nr:response regulator [Spirosoma radiotolerans]